jgi:hypothetical protein
MVHGSDVVAARLGDLQFDLGEGPSVDAFRERQPVLVPDVGDSGAAAGERWPAFAPAGLAAGARALFAFPLQLGAAQLGCCCCIAIGRQSWTRHNTSGR